MSYGREIGTADLTTPPEDDNTLDEVTPRALVETTLDNALDKAVSASKETRVGETPVGRERLLVHRSDGVHEIRITNPPTDPVDPIRLARDLLAIALRATNPAPLVAAAHELLQMTEPTDGSDQIGVSLSDKGATTHAS